MSSIKLDEELCETMTKIIAKSLLENYEDFKRKWYFSTKLDRHFRRFTYLMLVLSFSAVQGLELSCNIQTPGERRSFRERWRQFVRLRAPRFFYLLQALLLYCSLFIAWKLYYQYQYDINLAKLERICAGNCSAGRELGAMADELRRRAREARARVELVGTSHSEWNFAQEIVYLEWWSLSCVPFIGHVYLNLFERAHFSCIKWLFDEAAECRRRAEGTILELAELERLMFLSTQTKILESKDLLDDIQRKACHQLNGCCGSAGSGCCCHRRQHYKTISAQIDKIRHEMHVQGGECESGGAWRSSIYAEEHLAAVGQLRRIALEGRLNPPNKSRVWFCQLAVLLPACSIALAIYDSTWFGFAYFYCHRMYSNRGKRPAFLTAMDFHEAGTLFYVFLVVVVASSPMTVVGLLTALDQCRAVVWIRQLTRETITRSERRYCQLTRLRCAAADQAERLAADCLVRALEKDLLTVIVQYRLFIKEYKLAMRPFGFYGIVYLWLGFSLAVLTRTHEPYMVPEFKPLAIYVGYACLGPCFLYLLPFCQLHQDCLATYKTLYNLISQAIRYETAIKQHQSFTLKFALLVLRRELSEPRQAISKFTLRVLSLDVTKTTLLKMGFWVSLIVVPMLQYSSQSDEDLLRNILNDPLRIYSSINKTLTKR